MTVDGNATAAATARDLVTEPERIGLVHPVPVEARADVVLIKRAPTDPGDEPLPDPGFPARGELVINAGALAFSKDEGPVHVDPGCGFGLLLSPEGALLPGLKLVALSQEHGLVRATSGSALERLPVGATVRIVPNHSCLAAACFERYLILKGGDVVDAWETARGW